MVLPNTWSRRKRAAVDNSEDPLRYDEISAKVRAQIILIIRDAEKETDKYHGSDLYKAVTDQLRRELGQFRLSEREPTRARELESWLLNASVDEVLDTIEMVFKYAFAYTAHSSLSTDRVINLRSELNARLLEAAIGYQVHKVEVVQMTDEFNYREVVLPTLSLLRSTEFAAAEQEFLEAHRALREQDYSKVLVECHKSFESLLKVISAKRGWGTEQNANASTLIAAAFANGFIPPMMQSEFAALRSLLESSVPTVRNKSAAHGGGIKPHVIPPSLARLMVNQSAALLRFLAELHEEQ